MKQRISEMSTEEGHNHSVYKKVLIPNGQETGVVATYNFAWLDQGMQVEAHVHTDGREYYHILEGKGEMLLDKDWFTVEAGDFVTVQQNIIHSLKNPNSDKLVFTTMRTKEK